MLQKLKLKNFRKLILTSVILLSACNNTPSGCGAQICAPHQVKAWFNDHELPPELLHYLKLIGDQQEAIGGRACE